MIFASLFHETNESFDSRVTTKQELSADLLNRNKLKDNRNKIEGRGIIPYKTNKQEMPESEQKILMNSRKNFFLEKQKGKDK